MVKIKKIVMTKGRPRGRPRSKSNNQPIEIKSKEVVSQPTDYSCSVQHSVEPGKFNGYTRQEILECDISCLNLYQKVCKPRIKIKSNEQEDSKLGISRQVFDAFIEMCRCPVCLNVMTNPVMVMNCMHKFCANCIEISINGKK